MENWADRVAAQHGYTDVSHTLEIFGTCPTCAPDPPPPRPPPDRLAGVDGSSPDGPTGAITASARVPGGESVAAVRREDLRRSLPTALVSSSPTPRRRLGVRRDPGALWLHDLVQKLAVPGQKLEGAGGGLADNLAEAGGKVGRVPLVGDELTAPVRHGPPTPPGRSPRPAGTSRSWSTSWRWRWPSRLLIVPLGTGAVRLAAAAAALDAAGRRRRRHWPPRPPVGTCWPCARWPASRCASSPGSTRRRRGVAPRRRGHRRRPRRPGAASPGPARSQPAELIGSARPDVVRQPDTSGVGGGCGGGRRR